MMMLGFGFSLASLFSQPLSTAESDPPTPITAKDLTPDQALLKKMELIDKKIDSIQDFAADFVQKKSTPLLKDPLISTGSVRLKDTTIRWDTAAPHPSTMEITPGQIRIFDPSAHSLEVFQAYGDVRELTASPLPRLQTLTSRFKLSVLDPKELEVDQQTIEGTSEERFLGVELTPSSEDLKKHITKVRVVIDTTIPALVKMEMTDADGDTTLLTLRNIHVNTNLSIDDVRLVVPDGTRVSNPVRPAESAKPAASEEEKK